MSNTRAHDAPKSRRSRVWILVNVEAGTWSTRKPESVYVTLFGDIAEMKEKLHMLEEEQCSPMAEVRAMFFHGRSKSNVFPWQK